jgi:hypothetical protein
MYLQQLFAIFPLEDEVLYIPSTVVLLLHPSIRSNRRTVIGRYPLTHKFHAFICPKDRTSEAHKALLEAEYGEFAASIRVGEIRHEKRRSYTAYSGAIWKIQAGQKNLFEAFVCAALILFSSPNKALTPEVLTGPLRVLKDGKVVLRMRKQLYYFSENNRILPGEPAGNWQRLIMPAMRKKVISTLIDSRSKRWIVMDEFDVEPYISVLAYRAFLLIEKSRQRGMREWRDQVALYMERQKFKLLPPPTSEVDAEVIISRSLHLVETPERLLRVATGGQGTKQLVLWKSDEESQTYPVSLETLHDERREREHGEREVTHWVTFLVGDSFESKSTIKPLAIEPGQPVTKRKTRFRIKSQDADLLRNRANRDVICMLIALAACVLMLVNFNFYTSSEPDPARQEANERPLADFNTLEEYASGESQSVGRFYTLPDYSVPVIE